MNMAEEAVLFPNRPLFMVDRGWQRHKQKSTSTHTAAPYERELDLRPSRVPEVTITLADKTSHPRHTAPLGPTHGRRTQKKAVNQAAAPTQFLSYKSPPATKPGPKTSTKTYQRKRHRTSSYRNGAATEPKDGISGSPILLDSLPGINLPFYSILDPELTSFQRYAHYYPARMAPAMYPITKVIALTHNPVATVWFSAAMMDEVSLHTILFSCAMHNFLSRGQRTFKDADLMMKAILKRLNSRLNVGEYADLTIGAISCLAMCENNLGNHKKWKMHAVGMSEMIKERGGFRSLRNALHMKIYRSDTIGAVDTLSRPNFPRPVRTTTSLLSTLGLDCSKTSIQALLGDVGLTSTVPHTLIELSYLCYALNQAVDNKLLVEPTAFDEDVTCIQHDLLTSLNPARNSLERLHIITALIFIQTLTREVPFTRLCSSYVSRKLKEAFPATDVTKVPACTIFWMLFMGGMVSVDTDEKQWFRTRLSDFRQLRSDLSDWPSAKAQLQEVLWVDSMQDGFGLELWHDIDAISIEMPN